MISIDQIFKVVNFLATLFLFTFLFKKYLAPFFFNEKKKFDDGVKDKKNSRKLLQKQLDQLVVDQEEQVDEGKALEKKCKQWAQQMKKDRERKEEELRLARLQMVKHRQQQWIYIQNQRCLQQKLPMIFHDVEQYFTTLSDKENVSKKYCDTLITFMKD
jgi:hypothetical protein